MGAYHEEQIRQLSHYLNSAKIDQPEKLAIVIEAIRQRNAVKATLEDVIRSASKKEIAEARQYIAMNPNVAHPPVGAYFCKSCGSNIVPAPNRICARCRNRTYHVDVPEIPSNTTEVDDDTPEVIESGDYRRHKDDEAV